jgi:hypothetical protein
MADPGSVERNHAVHSKALGRPSQSGAAENFGTTKSLRSHDAETSAMGVGAGGGNTASLSWGRSGEVSAQPKAPVAPSGHGQQRNENESHNMADISKYPIYGGSRE